MDACCVADNHAYNVFLIQSYIGEYGHDVLIMYVNVFKYICRNTTHMLWCGHHETSHLRKL